MTLPGPGIFIPIDLPGCKDTGILLQVTVPAMIYATLPGSSLRFCMEGPTVLVTLRSISPDNQLDRLVFHI